MATDIDWANDEPPWRELERTNGWAEVQSMRGRQALQAKLERTHRSGAYQRIDRRTCFGNRFEIGRDGTRAEVIEKYEAQLWTRLRERTITLETLASVHGQTLVCWCAPLACHGNVLARAAAWAYGQLELGRRT